MSHPHLVQTYTYRVKPIENKPDDLDGCIVVMGGGDGSTIVPTNVNGGSSIISNNSSQDSNSVTSYELLLVLEYCDKGSLRSLLDVRGLEDENGRLNYPAALEIRATIDTLLDWRQAVWVPNVLLLVNAPEKFNKGM